MTVKYYAILTNQGAARLANATMLGSKLNLTQMAVGDANGVLPTPDPAQTKLINQKRIAPLNILSVDPNNQSQIIAEQIIPENEGGFWIREIGLYDDEGVLIAVANCPETYKPQLQEGSGRTQTIRMILVVTNTEAITLKIDPSVVLATRKYVDDEVLELRLYVDEQMRNHIAAQDPHTQYAQKHNPTFTGEPKAPTPAAGNNTTRIATTAFVQAAITALINGAPATLDTLKEIAAAINNDPKFSTTINNALSGKQPLDETLTHLSGKDVGAYTGVTAKWLHTKDPKPQKQKVKLKRKKKEKHLRALEHPKAKPVRQKKAPKVPEAREGEYMAGEADNVFALTTVYATKAQAMRAAQAKWDKLQRGVAEFSISLATGRADIYTETPVKVSGFKRVIDEQDWTITKVTHFLNNSGFTTSLELEVRLSDVEYETEDNE